jgi:two-component system, NtrC family, sensor histidine kinase PilS
MNTPSNKDQISVASLKKLMFLRVLVATFLLGIAGFIHIKGTKSLSPESIKHVFTIIVVIYIFSIVYVFLKKRLEKIDLNIQIQALLDVAFVTYLVWATGGVESVYSVLYQLIIIYSTLFLGRKGGLIAASASSIGYGILLNLEFYGVVTAHGANLPYDYSAGYVFSRIFIHIASFYIVALLVSFVVEQEKKSRSLLTQKESAFEQLDLLYRSIIKDVNAGIITVDLMGNVKSFNRAAEEITGFKFSQVKDKNINGVFPGLLESIIKLKDENRPEKSTQRGEITFSNKKGKDIILGFSVSALMSNTRERIGDILIFQDLTATKDLEKEIQKSKNLALIGEMAAGLTHEIRNPLTAMGGSIQLLQQKLDLDPTDARLMQIVLRGRDQLERLITNFLMLARPNQDERERLDMKAMVEDVIESLRKSPDWKETIKVSTAGNRSSTHANKKEMRQLLHHLLLNAIQAMPDGGMMRVDLKIIPSDNKDEWLEISISDNGTGIEKDNLGRIFTPFFSTHQGGTGLGLSIVNRIVESHGGEIKIESEAGAGTTCKVLLPIKNH